MHQAQWSPERPLPPPVSLASQSHHEKPPEVPAQAEGAQGFLPQPGKALERPSSTRLEARFPYGESQKIYQCVNTVLNNQRVKDKKKRRHLETNTHKYL